ncbi:MAG: EamA family transporter RarD [Thermoanaerobaculia bacterium]|nr:EamA family transporter RarD [Thermoanaerobaculia bacterium]
MPVLGSARYASQSDKCRSGEQGLLLGGAALRRSVSPADKSVTDAAREHRLGLAFTVAAFSFWGLIPIFWKLLVEVPAEQQLAHRIFWCAILMTVLLAVRGKMSGLGTVLSQPKTILALVLSTAMIGTNWFIFLYSIATDQLLQTSLGYFINPLVSVFLGLIFLREHLRTAQWMACGLAAVGVGVMTWQLGSLPWISLALAFSFGLYGLLRKTVPAGPEEGLALETWILGPIAALYLVQRAALGEPVLLGFGGGTAVALLLTGVVTALPLLWFTHGARRLPLSTVGMLQYIAPTFQGLLAVFAFGEPFDSGRLVAFAFIWAGLAIFTIDVQRSRRRRRRELEAAPAESG